MSGLTALSRSTFIISRWKLNRSGSLRTRERVCRNAGSSLRWCWNVCDEGPFGAHPSRTSRLAGTSAAWSVLYQAHRNGDQSVKDVVASLNFSDRLKNEKLILEARRGRWRPARELQAA